MAHAASLPRAWLTIGLPHSARTNDVEAALLVDERRRRNLARLRPVLWVMFVVHGGHIALFAATVFGGADVEPARAVWAREILGTHVVCALFDALTLFMLPRARKAAAEEGAPFLIPPLVAFAYLAMGAALAAFDQVVTASITPYISVTIGVAVLVRLAPVVAVSSQAFGLALFVVGQVLDEPNAAVRLSNIVNGASIATFAAALAVVLTRLESRDFAQGRVILRQKVELEEALARVRELADRAETANRAKSTFLGSMSHEVRTPLNGILGLASILEDEIADPQHRAWLATIQQSGRTLLAILEDLLVMSKLEADRVELRLGPCSPALVVTQVSSALEAEVRAKGLELAVDVDPATPMEITADDTRLRQIVFNLVGNAIKFTARGRIDVRLRTRPASKAGHVDLVLEVEDTGRGISPSDRERIFEPFVQGQRDRSETKPDGTGLGLAITKRLVALMGGTLELDSELGRGSRFTVHIPGLPVAS